MNIAYPFIYGRTMSIDYHWMQPPAHKLRIGFFADFVESSNHLIARGEQFCFVGLDERASVFSLALSLPDVCDRRGRPISFVFGYTVDSRDVREFAFRLPMLLKESGWLIARYGKLVRHAVETDGQVVIAPFNPFVSGETAAKDDRQDALNPEEKRNFPYEDSLHRRSDLESSGRAFDGWVEKMAEEIRLRIDTPRIVSNVDASRLGVFLDLPGTFVDHNFMEKKPVVLEKRPKPILTPPDIHPEKSGGISKKVIFFISGTILALLAVFFWWVGKTLLSERAASNPIPTSYISGAATKEQLSEAETPSHLWNKEMVEHFWNKEMMESFWNKEMIEPFWNKEMIKPFLNEEIIKPSDDDSIGQDDGGKESASAPAQKKPLRRDQHHL